MGCPQRVTTVDPDGDPLDHPEVVKLAGVGSAVVIGPNLLLTAAHIPITTGTAVLGGPDNANLVKIGGIVPIAKNDDLDLQTAEVNWIGPAPPCIRVAAVGIAVGNAVRLVGCGNPNTGIRGGATGTVLHAKCVVGDPAELAKWGPFHNETWIADIIRGHVCFRDSGGGAYSIASNESVLVGLISGAVNGSEKVEVNIGPATCFRRMRVILMNTTTVNWIAAHAGSGLCP